MFTLGLDLDGVCADYLSEFRYHAARSLGVDLSSLPEPRTWGFADAGWFTDEAQFLAVHADAVRDGLFRSVQPFPGVAEALWRLSDAGVHIRVITHRLLVNREHGVAGTDTIAWLDRHNIPFRDLCFVGRKAQVDADVYIDDAPHNVAALREAGRDVIVFDAPYNTDLAGPRARDWVEAEKLILERFRAWQRDQAA